MTAAIDIRKEDAREVVTQDRAGFGALRDELHQRCADLDLVELWETLRRHERRILLQSAQLEDVGTTQHVGLLSKTERAAIRAAIYRMSDYANRLQSDMRGEREHPSRDLAGRARQALQQGDESEAMHWLSLIEKGVA